MVNEIVRPSRKAWFSEIGYAIFFICIALFFFLAGKSGAVLGGISLLLAALLFVLGSRRLNKYFFLFTTDSLSGYVNQSFDFSRDKIQAIWFTGTKDLRILHIIENDVIHDIRCNTFDYSQLDMTLRKYYPPEVYSEYAYLHLPLIREWFEEEKKKLENINHVLTVKIRGMYIIPSMVVLIFSVLSILIFSAIKSSLNLGWVIPFIFIFIFGLISLFLPLDDLLVTNDSIRIKHFFKESEIPWNQLTKMSRTDLGYRVVFHGKTTRISMPLSDNWYGKDKQLISEIIEFKCRELQIPIEE